MSIDSATGGGSVERTLQMSRFMAKAGINCIILTTNSGLKERNLEKLQELNIVLLPLIADRFFIPKLSLL
jgi:spore coat polysaccharide biosynthesis predicted glycosyltransferase SpsG